MQANAGQVLGLTQSQNAATQACVQEVDFKFFKNSQKYNFIRGMFNLIFMKAQVV